MITVHIDGACSGNPGKCGIGYVFYQDAKIIKKESISLGVQTNNFAEYMALIFALTDLLGQNIKECEVFSDSQLLCEQINGNYKVRNENIFSLYVLAKKIIEQFKSFKISHVGREKNQEADELAKYAAK